MTKMLSQNKKCMDISAVCTGVCVNMGTKLLVCSQANRSQITLWPTRSTLESCWIYSSILMRDAVADGGTSGAGLGFSHTLPYWKDRGFCCFYQLVSSQPGKWAQDHSAMTAKLFLWKKKERGCKELHKECEGGWGLVGVGGGWSLNYSQQTMYLCTITDKFHHQAAFVSKILRIYFALFMHGHSFQLYCLRNSIMQNFTNNFKTRPGAEICSSLAILV